MKFSTTQMLSMMSTIFAVFLLIIGCAHAYMRHRRSSRDTKAGMENKSGRGSDTTLTHSESSIPKSSLTISVDYQETSTVKETVQPPKEPSSRTDEPPEKLDKPATVLNSTTKEDLISVSFSLPTQNSKSPPQNVHSEGPTSGGTSIASNIKLYEELGKIDWVMGHYSRGQSIDVFVKLGDLDPHDVEKKLAEKTGAPREKFHVKDVGSQKSM